MDLFNPPCFRFTRGIIIETTRILLREIKRAQIDRLPKLRLRAKFVLVPGLPDVMAEGGVPIGGLPWFKCHFMYSVYGV